MSLTRIPVIQFLKQRFPGYQQLPRSELWNGIALLRQSGEIRGLVPAQEGEQGIKLGPTKRQRVFIAFVEIGGATAASDIGASRRGAPPRLDMPRYTTVGIGRDEFFRSHLELQVAAHFKAVEPRYRGRDNGQAELAQEVQRFVNRAIAEWRGEDPDAVATSKRNAASKGASGPPAKKSPVAAKLARAKALRKAGKDSYTPKGGPTFVRILQGGSPQ